MTQSTSEATPEGETGVSVSQMKKTTVRVTQGDINRGVRSNSSKCPVALAINRVLKPGYKTFVAKDYIDILDTVAFGFFCIQTPLEVTKFIDDFDEYEKVEPFSFSLELPELVVRV